MMYYLGEVLFRANDNTDRFITLEVWETADEFSNDMDPNIGVNGRFELTSSNIPEFKKVEVAGDTTIIKGWFRGTNLSFPFTLRVYVECETVEEYVSNEPDDEPRRDETPKDLFY